MVKLRLQRHGRKKKPYYHIVAADSRSPRDGRIIEDLGLFNPLKATDQVILNEERAMYWIGTGAIPSDTVRNILKREGVYYRMHLKRWGKSEEEIDQTISEWKAQKAGANGDAKSKSEQRKAEIEAEEARIRKEEEEKAKEKAAKAKAEAEAKKKADEEARAAEQAAAEKKDKEVEAETAETEKRPKKKPKSPKLR